MHGLNDQARANRVVAIDQLKQHIEETLSTTRKMFGVGEVRLLAVLFVLLVAPAGPRRRAITKLHFRDIRVVLARDSESGPHNLLIRFTPKFTKEYLGTPTQSPKLCLIPPYCSSHVFLLGILFRHRSFRVRSLTSPDQLKKLGICPGKLEFPWLLREDLNDTYIFRRAILIPTGYVLSNEPIFGAMMEAWFKRIGQLLGLEYSTILYSLRYNAANEFGQSADVSGALRNLVLAHASSETFRRHYLGREIGADLWGILRCQKPQQALIKQSGSVGHSISKCRSTDLTQEQSASIATNPTIRRPLTISSANYEAIDSPRLRRRTPAVHKDRHRSAYSQRSLLRSSPHSEDQYQRRDSAIDAVSAYCLVQEGCTMRRPWLLPKDSLSKTPSNGSEGSPLYLATLSIYARNETERPRRCFVCIDQAHSLPPDDPRVDDLIQEFYSSNDLTKHFNRKHLSKMKENDKIDCKVCKMSLDHRMHFQNNAFRIHGTVS
ncbi:C2H2 finger domain protein [Colletotrichum tofieldiae]|uniref:C2H2 finger domain protein n=1 Tax=Colletotrichum tofieldiae TaxID=708197 RepID=A0A161WHR6_9PEZI|nr:C2H2 finger domain protein [Colletotrichum tofieldiae]